jgi:SM-20-related protein
LNRIISDHFKKIADGLATVGYAVTDDFLSAGEVRSILSLDEFQHGLLRFRKARIGVEKQINANIRGDYIEWIDKEIAPEELSVFLVRLSDLILYLNQTLFLSLKDYEIHKTVYPVGSHYQRHLDQLREMNHRKLSVICYLNVDWREEQGGQLRLFLPEGTKDIFPIAGRLVCFRSEQLEHEVLPATRERVSLTGWLLDQLVELKHL